MRKILDIPVIKQKYAGDCGIACAAMIMRYDGIAFDYDEAACRMKANLDDSKGIYTQELGSLFQERNYNTTLQTMNPYLFNLEHTDISSDELKRHIRWLKMVRYADNKDYINGLGKFENFMANGGTVLPRIPADYDIVNAVNDNRPVITLVTNGIMQNYAEEKRVGCNSHFVLVVGYDWQFFYAADPGNYCDSTLQKYKHNELMFCIHANARQDIDGASILTTSPKKKADFCPNGR